MENFLRTVILSSVFFLAIGTWAHSEFHPNGPLKVFKGPEGEKFAIVEGQGGKILVAFRDVGGSLEGKSFVYSIENTGVGDGVNVYYTYKRGSKKHQWIVLWRRDGHWHFAHPDKPKSEMELKFSDRDKDSKLFVLETINKEAVIKN